MTDVPVSWGRRIHPLILCRGIRLLQLVSEIQHKKYDGEASVIMELWGMRSNPLLLSLPGPLWPGVVAMDRAVSIGQMELFDILTELFEIKLFLNLTAREQKNCTYA